MHTQEIRDDLRHLKAHLATLRDELRVDLHLAALDVVDRWREIEKRVIYAERAARQMSRATRDALHEAFIELVEFQRSLRGHLLH